MKKIYTLAFILFSTLLLADIFDNDGKAGRTGSPGETDCTACHGTFPVNSGPGAVIISSPNLTNWQYVPGQVYQIDVTVLHPDVSLFGFGFEALQSNNTNGGILTITNSAQTQLKNASVAGTIRTNVVHELNGGASPDLHTFSFNWTAPATNIGNITFYTAANAANGLNDTMGDYIYKTSQVVTPFVSDVNEKNPADDFRIYPNPVSGRLFITTDQWLTLICIKLYDSKGHAVLKVNPEIETESIMLPVSELPSGIYLLVIETNQTVIVKKILISH